MTWTPSGRWRHHAKLRALPTVADFGVAVQNTSMTPLERTRAELRDALLAAVADESRWPAAAADLAGFLQVSGLVLAAVLGARRDVVAAAGLDVEVVAALLDESHDGAVEVRPDGDPGADLRSLAGKEPWRGLRDRLGAARDAARLLSVDASTVGVLWLLRDADRPPFEPSDPRVEEIVPAVSSALRARARLRRAEAESSLVREAFDRVTVGILLAQPDGAVTFANRAASRLLERGDGLYLNRGHLRARSRPAASELRAALQHGDSSSAPVAIAVPRTSGAPDLELLIASLGARTGPLSRTSGWVVFAVDPEGRTGGVEGHLRSLYGLTPAEARLTVQLLSGASLSGAARLLGVSRNTAHTQLSSVFAKTGTSGQNELIRRLLRGPAGFHREPTAGHEPVGE